MDGQNRCSLTPVGVLYLNQPSSEAPAYFISIADARDLKKSNKAWAINHGKDIRLCAEIEPDQSDKLVAGTMREAWHQSESAQRSEIGLMLGDRYPNGVTVWQMRELAECAT